MKALDELRQGLLDAAQRDVEAQRGRRRRGRRTAGVLVAVLLGGAAAATAADLIGLGEPAPSLRATGGFEQYKPTAERQVVLQSGGYGVALFTARNGETCALAGQLRGRQLGVVAGGSFRPYPADAIAPCVAPGRSTYDQRRLGTRTLVWGVAAPDVKRITADGETAPRGPGGAFLFVFEGQPPPGGFSVTFQ